MAKINVSMPDALLEDVDALAAEIHSSRSGFVAEATARYVTELREQHAEKERRERIHAAIEGMKRVSKGVGKFDSTAAIRWDREHGHETHR